MKILKTITIFKYTFTSIQNENSNNKYFILDLNIFLPEFSAAYYSYIFYFLYSFDILLEYNLKYNLFPWSKLNFQHH